MTRPIRLAIVVSHPIQHFVHFYRALAERDEIELKVFFCSRIGLDVYFDREMNTTIAWSMDLTSGYDHMFLREASAIKETRKVNNPTIGEELTRFDPDVVLTWGYGLMTYLRALVWCRRHRIPVMLIGDSELLRDRARWKSVIKSVALPAVLRQFTSFLTTGDSNEAYYRYYGVPCDRFFRVPFTIDEPSYRAARTNRASLRLAFRRAHGIDEHALIVLCVGKLYDQKRPADLLAAADTDANGSEFPVPFHMMFAGNGPRFSELSAQAQAKSLPATFLGFVNVDRLPEIYCAADILVHPSERDAHPLVCAEAACIGLPLVLSDRVGAVGPTDIARPDENAIVYPCGDVVALTEALRWLAQEPERLARMGEASKRIFDELDTRKSVDGTLAALRYCVDNRSARRTFLSSSPAARSRTIL